MPFLEISTTIGCPMACSYCPQGTIGEAYRASEGPRRMTFETFAAALNNCPPGLTVSFAGFAEPYLNRDCSRMIALAAGQGRPVQMYTTGVGMSDDDVDLLIEVQPKILMLHLPDGDGDMKASVIAEYVERIERLAESVKSFAAVCYGAMHPMLGAFERYLKNYGLHSRAGNVTHLGQVRKAGPLRCRPAPGLDENVLLPDGTLALCCNDWSLRHPVGNLLSETWEAIHGGEKMREIRRLMAEKDPAGLLCSTCEFAERA